MKPKDLIALVVALALLVGVGYYYYSSTHPASAAATASATQVEVAPVIPGQLDPSNTIKNSSTTYKVQDYKIPVDLSGLGNTAPFVSGQ